MKALLALTLAASAFWQGTPPAHVTRVATLAPSLTEIVLALGKGEALVGVSSFDDAKEVAKLPRLGGMVDPSAESILAAKPDVLFVQPSPGAKPILDRVAQLGVPVLNLPLRSIADVEEAERTIGVQLGAKDRGDALAAELVARVEKERLAARAKSAVHPRVLMVYGWTPLVVAGPGSFADELLRASGGLNAASEATTAYVTYSAETAAAAKPDVLLDLTFDEKMPEAFRTLPGLATARLVRPRSLALLHPGPQLVKGLDELHDALRGTP